MSNSLSSPYLLLFGVALLFTLTSAKSILQKRSPPRSSKMTSIPVAQADFALGLLREAGAQSDSMIMSPFSISTALAVAYLGADGNTKKEMNALLAKGNSDEQFQHYVSQQVEGILKGSEGITLSTANRLYVHNGFQLKDKFVNAVEAKYSGQLESVDFKQAAAVAKEINNWVEKQTHSKIKDLVSSDNIKEDSRVMIVNAVYFKGDWAAKFEKSRTKKKNFFASENSQREVDMMHRTDKYAYFENDQVQVLGMPYKGEEVKMFVFLPVEKYGLGKFLEGLSGQKLIEYSHEARLKSVEVDLPKFKLEKKFDLSDVLVKMGLKDAFNSRADFSEMCDSALYISDVLHKAFVEVNEEGTEAAAATAIGMRLRSAPMPIVPPTRFIADHPFMFAIMKGDTLLFVGKYV